MARIKSQWLEFLGRSDRRYEFVVAAVILTIVMLSSVPFLVQVDLRPGVQLTDPIHNMLPVRDLSMTIFMIIYCTLLAGFIYLLPSPGRLVIGFEAYAVFVLMRMVTMSVVPLEPPTGLIPLVDPVLGFMYDGKQVNKDLFFSGHTATMYLVYLMLPYGLYRKLAFVGALIMGACLISQRVHYTVDVIVAPFFAYGALRLVLWIRRQLNLPDEFERTR